MRLVHLNEAARFVGVARDTRGWILGLWFWGLTNKAVEDKYGIHPDPERAEGLKSKYLVQRSDGSTSPGGKHAGCYFYVLDFEHDAYARPALEAYVAACEGEYPHLAADLRSKLGQM